jgi:hypothetical protein
MNLYHYASMFFRFIKTVGRPWAELRAREQYRSREETKSKPVFTKDDNINFYKENKKENNMKNDVHTSKNEANRIKNEAIREKKEKDMKMKSLNQLGAEDENDFYASGSIE